MGKFVLVIKTNTHRLPSNRQEAVAEQYRLRDILVLVAGAITNRGIHEGEVTAIEGALATYCYTIKRHSLSKTERALHAAS